MLRLRVGGTRARDGMAGRRRAPAFSNVLLATLQAGTLSAVCAGATEGALARSLQAAQDADVQIVKTGTASARAGDTIRYRLTVRNNGPDPAANVFVVDTLPPRSRFLSASGRGTESGGIVRWPTVPTLRPTDPDLVYTVEVLAPGVGGDAPRAVFNTATVTASTTDSDLTNNVSRFPTVVEGSAPDLEIVKSAPESVLGGAVFTYRLTVTNNGEGPARDVAVTDSLPSNGILVSVSDSGSVSGRLITWPVIPTLAEGGVPRTYSVRYRAPAAPDILTNVGRVASSTLDLVLANNRHVTETRVRPSAPSVNLAILKTGPDTAVTIGNRADFTVKVTNLGPDTATQLVVRDTLPPSGGAVFVGASGEFTLLPSASDPRVIAWRTIPSLAPGADTAFTVSVLAFAAVSVNTAVARSAETDPVVDTAVVRTRARSLDVAVTKTGPDTGYVADVLEYVVTVRNTRAETVTGMVLTDSLPDAFRFSGATNGGVLAANNTVVWPARTLDPDSVTTDTITVIATTAGTFTNVAVVGAPDDSDLSNNRATKTTVVLGRRPDAAIDKGHTGPFVVGGQGEFTVRVTNLGDRVTSDSLTVTDTLPAGLTLPADPPSRWAVGDAGWTFSRLDDDRFRATYGLPLQPNDDTSFRITVDVGPLAQPRVVNRAWVFTPGDPNLSNNVDSTAVAVEAREVDVALEMKATGPFEVGDVGRFLLTVTNVSGDSTSGDVTLADTLPAGLTNPVPNPSPGWSFTVFEGQVSGTYRPLLGPGESTSFTLDVLVNREARPCKTNVARVETPGDERGGPRYANNVDSVTVCPPGDLFLRKDAWPSVADIGDQVDYRLIVGVKGRGDVPAVTVEDQLPFGFHYVRGTTRIDGTGADDPLVGPAGLLRFPDRNITGGDSVLITYRVQVGPGAERGDGINRAQAMSPDIREMPRDSARVQVRSFPDEGIILGKVFQARRRPLPRCPCEDLGEQLEGDLGIPGVRLFLQDGSSALTDAEGKYSFYGLRPRTWIVKVDWSTLPDAARLVRLTNRHSQDGSSALVDLTRGELHRADFAEASFDSGVRSQVEVRRERAAVPGLALVPGEPGRIDPPFGGAGTASPGFQPLLPDYLLTDRNTRLPAAPGLPEVPDGGGLRERAWQPRTNAQSDAITLEVEGTHRADGVTPVPVRVALTSGEAGMVTIESTASYWVVEQTGQPGAERALTPVEDADSVAPGLQVAVAAGPAGSTYRLVAPATPSSVLIRVSLDQRQARSQLISFLPSLRPLVGAGLLEARLDFRSLTQADLGLGRDRFEDELRSLQVGTDGGDVTAGARASLFLQGEVDLDRDQTSDAELTLRLDSEEDEQGRFFRDIQPDQFYPVYGDAGSRQYGAQSRNRFFGQLSRGSSFLMYGDFNTGLGSYGQTGARALGQYSRTLNGAFEHYETDRASVDAFASRNRLSQVVDEIPAQGISGPYALSRTDGLLGSERVELLTRDRDQPGLVLRSQALERFTDYTIEPLSGRIIFKSPIPSSDSEFNPLSIRVSYEVETGGEVFWILGANGQFRPLDRLEIGGGFVRDDDPASRFDLASVNATVELLEGTTYLIGELARTDRESLAGDAGRLELRHATERLDARLFYVGTDRDFDNPSSAVARGRSELGFRGTARVADRTQILAEFLRTESRFTRGRRSGGRIALEQAFGRWVRAQLGYRFAEETAAPATEGSAPTPDAINAVGARLTAALPFLPKGSVFGEFEQDVSDRDQRRALIGGDYRLFDRARIYGRHELVSSLSGPYGLSPGLEQNNTIFGVAADYLTGQSIFSEYRARDGFDGRDAHAAIGLRNAWSLDEGVRLSTSLERLSPLADGNTKATAVTGALELTQNPLWKASVRAEYQSRDGSDNLFGSVGVARRLNRDWTLLGKTVFSTLIDGDRSFEHTRLGLAYRQTERNRWNALARYEHRYDENPHLDDGVSSIRSAHVWSSHVNFQPDPDLILRAQWASKLTTLEHDGLATSESVHLFGTRGTLDITEILDVGVIGRALLSGTASGTQFGVGAELGVLLTDNLRVAAGYNVFGFRDEEPSLEEHTDRGFYVQLGFKFDEALFGRSAPQTRIVSDPCACPCSAPPCPPPPRTLEVKKRLIGPDTVGPGDSVTMTIEVVNHGDEPIGSVALTDFLPAGVEFTYGSRGPHRTGSILSWPEFSLEAGGSRMDTVVVRTPTDPVELVNRAVAESDVGSDTSAVSVTVIVQELPRVDTVRIVDTVSVTDTLNVTDTVFIDLPVVDTVLRTVVDTVGIVDTVLRTVTDTLVRTVTDTVPVETVVADPRWKYVSLLLLLLAATLGYLLPRIRGVRVRSVTDVGQPEIEIRSEEPR